LNVRCKCKGLVAQLVVRMDWIGQPSRNFRIYYKQIFKWRVLRRGKSTWSKCPICMFVNLRNWCEGNLVDYSILLDMSKLRFLTSHSIVLLKILLGQYIPSFSILSSYFFSSVCWVEYNFIVMCLAARGNQVSPKEEEKWICVCRHAHREKAPRLLREKRIRRIKWKRKKLYVWGLA
jgi:hypothetical protein